jgi:hypothetical protein
MVCVNKRTCCGDSCEHPALSELDGLSGLKILVEDFDRAGPCARSHASRVLSRPVSHQHAGVVIRVDLHANPN